MNLRGQIEKKVNFEKKICKKTPKKANKLGGPRFFVLVFVSTVDFASKTAIKKNLSTPEKIQNCVKLLSLQPKIYRFFTIILKIS